MMRCGIFIGSKKMQRGGMFLCILAILLIVGEGCTTCETVKTSDAVLVEFNTPTKDTFQVGEPVLVYLNSTNFPSLYNSDKWYNYSQGRFDFYVYMYRVSQQGYGDRAIDKFNIQSDMADIETQYSTESIPILWSIKLNIDNTIDLMTPALQLTPLDTGNFAISFGLGDSGSIYDYAGKDDKCDLLVDVYAAFSNGSGYDAVLDNAGIVYMNTISLPGGYPMTVKNPSGFYVKH